MSQKFPSHKNKTFLTMLLSQEGRKPPYDSHQPGTNRKGQETVWKNKCRLVLVECGLRRMGNGYVKRNQ